jgi:exodeoxyribonuclease III
VQGEFVGDSQGSRLRVATFNINGVNQRLANLLEWLSGAQPDVACLQEIKCTNQAFPRAEIERAGYGAIWKGQGRDHGVAILARGADPVETRRVLPGDPDDLEARYLEAAVEGVLIGCLYLPNGNPQPGPKFAYKLRWFERLLAHAAELHAAGVPAVLAGDYNVVPTDHDIYNMRSWLKNALVQPKPRSAFARLLREGWTDALGEMHPYEQVFTFWAYLRDSWPRDAGLRIDHLLVSQALLPRLVASGVDREVRGQPGASDHAPAWIELA